jgi:hypothetical protein
MISRVSLWSFNRKRTVHPMRESHNFDKHLVVNKKCRQKVRKNEINYKGTLSREKLIQPRWLKDVSAPNRGPPLHLTKSSTFDSKSDSPFMI